MNHSMNLHRHTHTRCEQKSPSAAFACLNGNDHDIGAVNLESICNTLHEHALNIRCEVFNGDGQDQHNHDDVCGRRSLIHRGSSGIRNQGTA